MKKLVYIGCAIALLILQQPYGGLICICNALSYIILLAFLVWGLNSKGVADDWIEEIKPKQLVFLAIFGIGPIIGMIYLYRFYKRPIKRDRWPMTEEEFEADLLRKKREHRLKRLGI
jgi:hypothetical protein